MAKAATAPAGAFFANWRQNIIYIGFVVIFVVFALTLNDKGFLNPNNLLNIVRQTAMIAVMAVAMTFVLSAGEIDLSVGAVMGISGITAAMTLSAGAPVPVAVGAGLLGRFANAASSTAISPAEYLAMDATDTRKSMMSFGMTTGTPSSL